MIRSRHLLILPFIAVGLSVTAATPLKASPLERLHDRVFGDDDDHKKKDKDKKKKHKDDHDRDYRKHGHHQCYDRDRSGRCDLCGHGLAVRGPVIQINPVRRYEYVEPAPRPYYERREEIHVPAPRTYQQRSLEADVQLALRRAGYYRGPVDGDIGPGTRVAISEYQYDRGLPVTGRIDRNLIRSLGL